MTRPMVTVVTGESFIQREMNDTEYAAYLIDQEAWQVELQKKEEADALASAKAEATRQALAALGLSQEIVNLLAE